MSRVVMWCLALVISGWIASPAWADTTASATATVSGASRAAAEKLLDHLRLDQTYQQLIVQMSNATAQTQATTFKHLLPESGLTDEQQQMVLVRLPEFQEQMRTSFQKFMQQTISWEKMRPMIADAYARNFTVDELNEIDHFYSSPTGQKALQRMPLIMQQYMAQLMPLMSQNAMAFQKEVMGQTFDFIRNACQCTYPVPEKTK